ncbi:hypothetical protein XENORESO_017747, partial [Xenotaenia resolanae]
DPDWIVELAFCWSLRTHVFVFLSWKLSPRNQPFSVLPLSLSLPRGPGTQTDTETWNTYLLDFLCLLLRADLPPKSLTNPLLCTHSK